jgi:hypothetical protein
VRCCAAKRDDLRMRSAADLAESAARGNDPVSQRVIRPTLDQRPLCSGTALVRTECNRTHSRQTLSDRLEPSAYSVSSLAKYAQEQYSPRILRRTRSGSTVSFSILRLRRTSTAVPTSEH